MEKVRVFIAVDFDIPTSYFLDGDAIINKINDLIRQEWDVRPNRTQLTQSDVENIMWEARVSSIVGRKES